jgi:predicted GNAT family acetyltransferase
MATRVRKNADGRRYELYLDDELVGVADYSLRGDTVVFPHTEINAPLRGRGLGAVLVRAALDDVRAAGLTVVPQCWFVAQFIDDNPEYADLLAA